ncbi:MAG: glycosyltransferase family 2 protein [Clostridia bacterium]|nr:glycosyltransferase family 2 protein [Clostridia bacterium]
MLSNPLVSVVIPMYNVERYIEETLTSVLNQTYKNIEVVVIDDSSRDKSADIVKKMQSRFSNLKYIYKENGGVSSARNVGIRNSTGEYIAFLDSDDLWLETKLEAQISMLNATGLDACYCGYREFFNIGQPFKKMPGKFYEGKILKELLLDKAIGWTSTWVIKKDLILNNGLFFTEGCSMAEDIEFFSKVTYFVEVCAVKDYLALYRRRSDSLTASPDRTREILVWKRLKEWLDLQISIPHYDKKVLIDILSTYRIAGVSIHCLYEEIKNRKAVIGDLINDELYKYVKDYKPVMTIHSTKLLIKKILLTHPVLLRALSRSGK